MCSLPKVRPPNWISPYYSVGFQPGQSISVGSTNHQLYFYNWTASGANIQDSTAAQTGVEFTSSSGGTVTSNLKGTQLSNNASAFSNNSQRKLVETPDGWLHQVYESMGHVWYEAKSPAGSWQIMNNGKPLDNDQGKDPSIDWFSVPGHYIMITAAFQQKSGSSCSIQYAGFIYQNGTYSSIFPASQQLVQLSDNYSVDVNPNIAWGDAAGRFVLTY